MSYLVLAYDGSDKRDDALTRALKFGSGRWGFGLLLTNARLLPVGGSCR
jgi:hypothetical protein